VAWVGYGEGGRSDWLSLEVASRIVLMSDRFGFICHGDSGGDIANLWTSSN
jgi:hypothetical protein